MTRLALAIADAELAARVGALVEEDGELEAAASLDDPARLIRTIRRVQPDVLVLHDARGLVSAVETVREVAATFPEVGIVLLGPDVTPDVLRTAVQAGARDVVGIPLSLEELQTSVRAAAGWAAAMRERVGGGESEAAAASGPSGRLVAFAGAKGGVGTTTVALHVALASARSDPDRRVCLADFDLQTGDFRTLLDLPYRRSVVDLLDVAEELTVRQLDETLYAHRSGIRVLLAPDQGEQAEEVGADATRNILGAVRARHDLTIVDVGAVLSEAGAVACEIAAEIVVVTTPDVAALRGVQRLSHLWKRLQVTGMQPRVLVNRMSRRREIQPDLVRRVVGDGLCRTTIPAAFASLEAAVNSGTPERLEDRKLLDAYAGVARELDLLDTDAVNGDRPPEEKEAGGGGLLARLSSERGQSTVEFMGLLPVILVIIFAIWQIGLVGYTYLATAHAAREGARELAIGGGAGGTMRDEVPTSWQDGLRCAVGEDRVRVSLAVPMVLPGLDSPFRISSQAGTTIEEEPVEDDPQRSLELPEERKDDPCHEDEDDDEDEKDEEEDEEDDDEREDPGEREDDRRERV